LPRQQSGRTSMKTAGPSSRMLSLADTQARASIEKSEILKTHEE
jgi:hypothetical protein